MGANHPAALGRPVAEVWGDAWTQVSPPFLRTMQTGEGFSRRDVELALSRGGQLETTYWNFTASPVRGEDGTIVGLLNQGVEITDQVLATRQLRALSETLEAQVAERTHDRNSLWQLSSDIMLRCDFEGRITAVNPASQEVLGWTEAELVGSNLFDLVHPEDMEHTAVGARELSEGIEHTRFDNR